MLILGVDFLFLDFRRYIKSIFSLICLSIIFLMFIFGYILLVTIDNVSNVSIIELFHSIYTVFTQFGVLMFSPVVLYVFYVDYKDKNILFYKRLGISPLKYFLNKVITLTIIFAFSIILFSFFVSLFYGDFSLFLYMITLLFSVSLSFIITISVFGFVFDNFIVAFFSSFSFWIISIILSSFSNIFSYFSFFDASNSVYNDFTKYFESFPKLSYKYLHFEDRFIYNLILFSFAFLLIFIFRKRWLKNGV